jgi:hypothetical protein
MLDGHAKRREVERYGQRFKHRRLLEKIRNGEAVFIREGEQDRLVYAVPYRSEFNTNIVVQVVVDAEKKGVVTVLPPSLKSL